MTSLVSRIQHPHRALSGFPGTLGALGVALALFGSGCKEDPEPTPADSGAPSAEPTSSATDVATQPVGSTSNSDEPAVSVPASASTLPSGTGSGGAGGASEIGTGGSGASETAGGTGSAGAPDTESTGAGGTEVNANVDAGAGGTLPSAADAAVDPCLVPEFVAPTLLSETGLYTDVAAGALAPGVREYRPRFELWSDGAAKRRFVYLPPCSQIDTTNPDYWVYPIGTKLWKEFTRNNEAGEPVRVETRIFQKRSATKWFWTAFIWNDEQTDASIAEGDEATTLLAQENAKGTPHDVPGQKSCETCHFNMPDQVLGFSALQLDFDSEAGLVDLATLTEEGLLTEPIPATYTLPGTEAQQAALGYMHANCGACHNPNAKEATLELQFWLELDKLGSVETTPTYLTTVGQESKAEQPPADQPLIRITPGDLESSAVYWRMTQPPTYPATPKGGTHMPLIGTETTDEQGVQLVTDWINSLPPE